MSITKQTYEEKKQLAFASLGGKCAVCGIEDSLEFDHIDPKNKYLEVTRLFDRPEVLQEELKKCQLLCKKHHFEKTLLETSRKSARGTHGTLSSYRYCHCSKCRESKSKSNALRKRVRKRPVPQLHGTHASYKKCGPPKCVLCKAGHNEYMKAFYKKNIRPCSSVGRAFDL